jgi:hypothetical protein
MHSDGHSIKAISGTASCPIIILSHAQVIIQHRLRAVITSHGPFRHLSLAHAHHLRTVVSGGGRVAFVTIVATFHR